MRNELIYLQFTGHVVVNKIRQLRPALDAAECATFPDSTGDQLEGWDMISMERA